MVALVHQGTKSSPRAGGHLDPQARVGRTADHGLCHCGVRGFIAFETSNVLAQSLPAPAGLPAARGCRCPGRLAKAGTGAGDVREGLQAERLPLATISPWVRRAKPMILCSPAAAAVCRCVQPGGGCRLFQRVKAGEVQRPSLSARMASTLPVKRMSRCSAPEVPVWLHAPEATPAHRRGWRTWSAHGHCRQTPPRRRAPGRRAGRQSGGQPRLRLPLCPQQLGAKFTELGRLPLPQMMSSPPSCSSHRLRAPHTCRYDMPSVRAAVRWSPAAPRLPAFQARGCESGHRPRRGSGCSGVGSYAQDYISLEIGWVHTIVESMSTLTESATTALQLTFLPTPRCGPSSAGPCRSAQRRACWPAVLAWCWAPGWAWPGLPGVALCWLCSTPCWRCLRW